MLRAIRTSFPSNFANGNIPWNIVDGTEYLLDSKGFRITKIAKTAEEALEKHLTTTRQ